MTREELLDRASYELEARVYARFGNLADWYRGRDYGKALLAGEEGTRPVNELVARTAEDLVAELRELYAL